VAVKKQPKRATKLQRARDETGLVAGEGLEPCGSNLSGNYQNTRHFKTNSRIT